MTAGPARKNMVLGNGYTGFHVTLECFDFKTKIPNPHAYRGLQNAVPASFVQASGKRPWPAIAPELEKHRNDAVQMAEDIVDAVKTSLGAPLP